MELGRVHVGVEESLLCDQATARSVECDEKPLFTFAIVFICFSVACFRFVNFKKDDGHCLNSTSAVLRINTHYRRKLFDQQRRCSWLFCNDWEDCARTKVP